MSRVRVVLLALSLSVLALGPATAQVALPADTSGAAPPGQRAAVGSPGIQAATGATSVSDTAGTGQSAVVTWRGSTADALGGQTQVSNPTETFRIRLFPGGNARWTVMANFTLSGTRDEAAFEELAADFEAGRTESNLGLDAFRRASRLASSSTGREMAITRVQRDHTVYNDTGQLVLRFTWTNFSRVSGDRLYVDDVFNTTGGTWFSGLARDQRLIIVPPDTYQIIDAEPQGYAVTRGALHWDGYQEFDGGELQAVYRQVGQTPTTVTSRNGTNQPDRQDGPLLAVLAVVGIGAVAVVAYIITTREGGLPVPDGPSDDGDETGATSTDEPDPAGAGEPGDEEPVGGAPADGPDDQVDEELLSDEERIERLLERNGGRMKQANIVKETGWSNAKVSQLLSTMDEDDRIDKLRIGRENLISFPDEDVTDLDTDDSDQ